MNYEKAYKEALERAREFQKSKDGLCVLTAESIFPELKESDDEKVREALIEYFSEQCDMSDWNGVYGYQVVAWLEKQKSVSEIVERCKNSWYNEGKIAGQFEGITDDEKYQQGWHDALEKQGEQKPTDKVEPKFKVGDWIITKDKNVHKDYSVCKIIEIENNRYHLENGDYLDIDTLEQYDYRLWTIEDAKDGDVLVDDLDNICIYQESSTKFMYHSYCYGNNKYFVNSGGSHQIVGTCPATKEQRDTLFKAMAKAGYQWNPDKKELKKVEQKIAWSKKDEEIFENLSDYLENESIFSENEEDVTYFNEYNEWLKSLKERLI